MQASKVTTPLLILHGAADVRVPTYQGRELFEAVLAHGKTARMVTYPGSGHFPAPLGPAAGDLRGGQGLAGPLQSLIPRRVMERMSIKQEGIMAERLSGVVLAVSILSGLVLLAQGAPQCPPSLASLMPASAAHVTCQYNAAGSVGIGYAAGDLPYDDLCSHEPVKLPGHMTFDIKHFGGDSSRIFKMQIDSEEQQRVSNKKAEFEKMQRDVKGSGSELLSLSPVKTENVGGGILLYFDYSANCSEEFKRPSYTVHLLGVAHNDTTAINIEIEGNMSAEAARAAASEVLGKFAKADFNKLDK